MYIGVDVGGTFTDIAVNPGDGRELYLHKLPSTPDAPEKAVIDGLREILVENSLEAGQIRRLAHGTTVGTNALIQRKCGKVALITSEGFRDLLELARQTRPTVYDMHRDHPEPLVPRNLRIEVPQRRLADGTVHVPLASNAVADAAACIAEAGVDCVVVCFLHSYAFPEDEDRAAEILRANLPDSTVVLTSSSVYPEFREYERFSTAVLNAALITVLGSYLDRLMQATADMGIPAEIKISQSSGGLMSVRMAKKLPVRASLSGPAAGVQGALYRAAVAGIDNIITLDMGGTSADVALLENGVPVEVVARDLAGFPIRIPSFDVNAVGAGGGSIAWIDSDGLFKVGPRSAGAVPGPVCYNQGGTEPTVTDANVMLGRLNGSTLLGGRMPIRHDLSVEAIARLAGCLNMAPEDTALGIVQVACATMVKAIRSISVERGYAPSEFSLFVFGGAGALHAVDVARELGMGRIVVPPSPGILCAEGAMNAPLSIEFVATLLVPVSPEATGALARAISELDAKVSNWFASESVPRPQQKTTWTVAARYLRQNYELTLPIDIAASGGSLLEGIDSSFHNAHERNYGFCSPGEPVQLVNLSVKALGELPRPDLPVLPGSPRPDPGWHRDTLFWRGDSRMTPVYDRAELVAGQAISGPAIIEQMDATVLVFPGDECVVDNWGNIIVTLGATGA
ncbi:MAG: hydantoinase/oxoprolinase family protein [Paracoccaceae bacterium]|nr:hydantoinase/oxoprolinase family protein [Paracoccaceae bacterium]